MTRQAPSALSTQVLHADKPYRQVTRRGEGRDLLECGHEVLALKRAWRRRCPECPRITPAGVFRVVGDADVLAAFRALTDEQRGELLARVLREVQHGA